MQYLDIALFIIPDVCTALYRCFGERAYVACYMLCVCVEIWYK
jgi:hypothetical protein